MEIRLATLDDLLLLIDLIKEFYETTPWSKGNFQEDKVAELLHSYIQDKENYCVIVSEMDTQLVGIFIGIKSDMVFSDETSAREMIWYVDQYLPPMLKAKIGLKLLNTYQYWAKFVAKADYTILTHYEHFKLDKILEKSGFKLIEKTHVMENNNGN